MDYLQPAIGIQKPATDKRQPATGNQQEGDYKITQESVRLLGALQHKSIRFAHWKSNSHLLKSLAGKTDLDLLIVPEDRGAFESVMQALGYKQLQSQAWSAYPQVEDWIGFDEETGNFLHLHTHYAMVTGIQHVKHLYLPWMEVFFQHVMADAQTGWPIPRPEMEALILLVRMWAKMPPRSRLHQQPEIPVYLQQELRGLLEKADPQYLLSLCGQLQLQVPADLLTRIDSILRHGNPAEMLVLSQYFYKQLKPYYRKSWPQALAQSLYYKYFLKANRTAARLTGPVSFGKKLVGGGKVIALVGCDGSGKSTLTGDILKWLTYKIDTHYFYLGKNPFIKSYHKVIFSKTDLILKPSFLARKGKKVLGRFYFVALIRRKIEMLRLARKLRLGGSIVICDRFPQQQVQGMNDGPYLQQNQNNWPSQLEREQFNQAEKLSADMVFKLRVTPEVAAKRKPEHDFEIIKQKSASMARIKFENALVIEVNADLPYEQVLLHIKREIWKNL